MLDPEGILWESMKGVVYDFSTNMGNGIKMGTDKLWADTPLKLCEKKQHIC